MKLIYESAEGNLCAQICYNTIDNSGRKSNGIFTICNNDNLSVDDFKQYVLSVAEEKAMHDCTIDNENCDYDEKENFVGLNWIDLIDGDDVIETLL